jgi:microcystin-dependent protein
MEPFIGEIRIFAGNFAPVGWDFCNGQLLQINQYTALFSILGGTYGGDGKTTFALPDFRGRVPIHQGQGSGLSPHNPGDTGGSEQQTLTVAQMPAHSHQVVADNNPADSKSGSPQDTRLGNVGAGKLYSGAPHPAAVQMNPGMISSTGGGQPVPTMSPFLCTSFIIAMQGLYPQHQ